VMPGTLGAEKIKPVISCFTSIKTISHNTVMVIASDQS
jgi:hypothetical protein